MVSPCIECDFSDGEAVDVRGAPGIVPKTWNWRIKLVSIGGKYQVLTVRSAHKMCFSSRNSCPNIVVHTNAWYETLFYYYMYIYIWYTYVNMCLFIGITWSSAVEKRTETKTTRCETTHLASKCLLRWWRRSWRPKFMHHWLQLVSSVYNISCSTWFYHNLSLHHNLTSSIIILFSILDKILHLTINRSSHSTWQNLVHAQKYTLRLIESA